MQNNEENKYGADCPRALTAFLDLFEDYRPAARQLIDAYHANLKLLKEEGVIESDDMAFDQEMNGTGFDYQADPALVFEGNCGTSMLAIGRIKTLIDKVIADGTSPVMLPDFTYDNRQFRHTSRPLAEGLWPICLS